MNPKVDKYLVDGCMRCSLGATPQCKVNNWQKELVKLRNLVLESGLTEELKWGVPCYTFKKTNVVLIHGFKEYCAFLFHKGVLLKDTEGILIQQTEYVQSARQIRFTNLEEIEKMEAVLKAYIYEAMEVEKAGLKVDFKAKNELVYPEELLNKFKENSSFKTAFEALTPGRKRGYILHFTQAKQSKTREARIEKCAPLIFEGKGWNGR